MLFSIVWLTWLYWICVPETKVYSYDNHHCIWLEKERKVFYSSFMHTTSNTLLNEFNTVLSSVTYHCQIHTEVPTWMVNLFIYRFDYLKELKTVQILKVYKVEECLHFWGRGWIMDIHTIVYWLDISVPHN